QLQLVARADDVVARRGDIEVRRKPDVVVAEQSGTENHQAGVYKLRGIGHKPGHGIDGLGNLAAGVWPRGEAARGLAAIRSSPPDVGHPVAQLLLLGGGHAPLTEALDKLVIAQAPLFGLVNDTQYLRV